MQLSEYHEKNSQPSVFSEQSNEGIWHVTETYTHGQTTQTLHNFLSNAMRKLTVYLSAVLMLLQISCKDKAVPSAAGKINLEAMVYNDPNGDVYDSFLVDISTLYYRNGHLLETWKDDGDSLLYSYVNLSDSLYTNAYTLLGLTEAQQYSALKKKNYGAVFYPENIPNYENKEVLADTAFDGFSYKRIRIVTDSSYNVYYLHQTDTIYPFSLHREMEKEIGGVINRIDSYDLKNDKFISLKMNLNDTIPESIYTFLNLKNENR